MESARLRSPPKPGSGRLLSSKRTNKFYTIVIPRTAPSTTHVTCLPERKRLRFTSLAFLESLDTHVPDVVISRCATLVQLANQP